MPKKVCNELKAACTNNWEKPATANFDMQKLLLVLCVVFLASCSKTYTANDYKKAGQDCFKERDLNCAEENWAKYVQMRPNDSSGHAHYALLLNWNDKPDQAIVQAERAISMGEGTYDLYAAYAASLEKAGRTDEAIDWSYKTLAIVPSLVDVRGSLAKMLVQKNRQYEALALLTSFDDGLIAKGKNAYFEGQRMAIESNIDRLGNSKDARTEVFRVTRFGDHFYAPVRFGVGHASAFMVDTGASLTTMNDDMLKQLKSPYKVVNDRVPLHTADGRVVSASQITVESMNVGPFELHNMQIFICPKCASLLGQNALSKFNLKSSKNQGTEFLTFESRAAH